MANTIKLKRTSTPSSTPSSLEYGELAINYADGKIFYKNSSNNIVEFTSGSIGSVALDDLSDVIIATPASAEILRYNGTNWVNSATTNITALGTLSSLTVTNNITAAQFYGRARDTEIRFFMEVI
jgi:hypothetical protein